MLSLFYGSSFPEVLCKKAAIKNFAKRKKNPTYTRVSFLIKLQAEAYNYIKKKTLAQVFSSEFCKILKNT